jgi:hypothetical protein
MSKELLDLARALALDVEEMSAELLAEYDKWVDVVRTNGLERIRQSDCRTTFETASPVELEWQPDSSDAQDIVFADGDDRYFMPAAYLEDPEAWLQGALAAHGQATADNAAAAAQRRAARKADLRRQLDELETQG